MVYLRFSAAIRLNLNDFKSPFQTSPMMNCRITCSLVAVVLLCWICVPARAFSQQNRKVAILIRPELWETLQSDIHQYMADVRKQESLEFEVMRQDFQSPEQIRDSLRRLWEKEKIEGAILIGALPMHRFYMHEHANPNPLFYEDFSLEYVDENQDGAAESYLGTPKVRIWVANIRPSELANHDDVTALKSYFQKLKLFRDGKLAFEKRAIIVTDVELGLRSDEAKLGRFLFGESGVELLATPKNTLSEFRNAFRDKAYAICTMGVHSDWSGQGLEQGELSSQEIQKMKTGAILTLNHGCFTGNWCVSEKEGTGISTAQAWAFGDGIGITVVANVRSGCIYGYPALCDLLREGESIGAAYLAAKQAGEAEMHRDYPDGSIVSGVLLLGDPFLKFHPAVTEK